MAKRGDRIEVLRCEDEYLREVSWPQLGTVDFVDALGTVHVSLDNGISLGLVADQDEFRLVEGWPGRGEGRP